MSTCDPDLCWSDQLRLDGCDEIVCTEHDPEVIAVDVRDQGGEWLHEHGKCPACDSCWEDVAANAAYDAEHGAA